MENKKVYFENEAFIFYVRISLLIRAVCTLWVITRVRLKVCVLEIKINSFEYTREIKLKTMTSARLNVSDACNTSKSNFH